jgi:hypothetical protein
MDAIDHEGGLMNGAAIGGAGPPDASGSVIARSQLSSVPVKDQGGSAPWPPPCIKFRG